VDLSRHQKRILNLLADGEFHSGTELASDLNISRSAICKQLNALTRCGVEFNAISGKGYSLHHPIELFEHKQIDALLSDAAREQLQILEIHDQLESTNSYLSQLENVSTHSGHVCLAEHQTSGKGRLGRHWVSPFGHNIYLSIRWDFQTGPQAVAGLSLAVGVAVIEALLQLNVTGIGLKWPNDLYWQGRKKLGGILVEMSGETHGPCTAVIGIGLNIRLSDNQAQTIDQQWTDLTRIMGGAQGISRNALAAALINELLPLISSYESVGLNTYLDAWRSFDCMLEKPVTLLIGNRAMDGIVKGIDDKGLLLLEDRDGELRTFASGEVSFHKGINGYGSSTQH